jgi:cephalosporin-C deacetylase-like acetyl esterase
MSKVITIPIPADMAVSVKFAAFNIVDVHYKTVNGVAVPASILIPKDIRPGKHPLLVRWHGGCLITGHRMFPEW